MKSKFKFDAQDLAQIRKKHRLDLILLHGSQAEGKTHPQSDLDIAVLPQKKSTQLDLLTLYAELAKVLNHDRVDIVNLKGANPLLLKAVTDKAQLLAGDKSALENLRHKAFHQYSDYAPYLEREQKYVKERLKSYGTS